jgi:pyridine nucleotide-disulfide oxidoreductase family protein
LILAGGGHAHLFVLQQFARQRRTDLEIVLITPSRWQMYSGMLPGWMSGEYRIEDCRIDLQALAERAGATLIESSLTSLDASRRTVRLADGSAPTYDLLSIDTGSESDLSWCAVCDSSLVAVKPLAAFLTAWLAIQDEARRRDAFSLAVIGGGAAGVEIAVSARHVLNRIARGANVTMIAGESGLLPSFGASTRRRVARSLAAAGVEVILGRATHVVHGVRLADGVHVPADRVIAAAGAAPCAWIRSSGLTLDGAGYIEVDAFHRSLSHENVFAAGDICSAGGGIERRSGVDAVRAGPILACNLLAAFDGNLPREHRARRSVLSLIAVGGRRAILSYGNFCADGTWVWRWKDRIDRRFVRRFSPRLQDADVP